MRFLHGAQRSLGGRAVALCCSLLLAAAAAAAPQSDVAPEYEVKAAYLYNFLKFVEWPNSVLARLNGRVGLCVLGSHPVADALAAVRGKKIAGRTLVIDTIQDTDHLESCQALFIPHSAGSRVAEAGEKAKGMGILTVTESDEIGAPMGMINLWELGDRMVFSVDLDAAQSEGLTISQLLVEVAVDRDGDATRIR